MDKNFILFFVVATAAIFIYYTVFPPESPAPKVATENEQVQTIDQNSVKNDSTLSTVSSAALPAPAVSATDAADRKVVTVETDLYKIEIDTLDGVVKNYWLKEYKYASKPQFRLLDWGMAIFRGPKPELAPYDPDRLVNMAGDISESNQIWKVSVGLGSKPVVFQTTTDYLRVDDSNQTLTLSSVMPSGLEVYKSFQFNKGSYEVNFETRIVNRTGRATQIIPSINFGAGNEAIELESMPQNKMGCAYVDGDFEKYDDGDIEDGLSISKATWAGTMDKYFVSVTSMADSSAFKGQYTPTNSSLGGKSIIVPQLAFIDSVLTLGDGQEYTKRFRMYNGPKEQARLDKFDVHLPLAMNLGWFDFLAHPLLSLLRWIQKYVHNWGVAIIILTIIVRGVMSPLQMKGMMSMRRMSALNPQIKVIREKYKKDKERMNKEVMQFYSQNKINPMSGCLPMVLQIPIFFALYRALLPAVELRHEGFIFWLNDLSLSDPTLILPILMGISMFIQQTKMPMTSTATMDPTQQKMMKWMPVVMVVFFLSMPAGLVLYWVVSNVLTILINLVFNKITPAPELPVTGKKGKAKAALKAPAGKNAKGGKKKDK